MNSRQSVMDEIEYHILTTENEFDELRDRWQDLSENCDSTIFQTFDWNRTWWKYFGTYGELQIFILSINGELAGIAPLFLDRVTRFGLPYCTHLRFIGSYISRTENGSLVGQQAYSDYLQFLIKPGSESIFINYFIRSLDTDYSFSQIILDEVPEYSVILQSFVDQLRYHGYEVQVTDTSILPVSVETSGWEEFVLKREGKERNNIRRTCKRVDGGPAAIFRLADSGEQSNWDEELGRFIDMHQAQWNQRDMPGTFAEKKMHDFFYEIATLFHKKGWLRIHSLYAINSNKLLASNIIIEYRKRCYMLHRAMQMNSEWIKKAPGKALLLAEIRKAIEDKNTFEFLRGGESYKLSLSSHVRRNKKLVIQGNLQGNRIRGKVSAIDMRIRGRIALERANWTLFREKHNILKAGIKYLMAIQKRIFRNHQTL